MQNYKGYYIDHVFFNSKEEIDSHIKAKAIEKYKMLCTMFAENPSVEMGMIMSDQADYMHRVCGMDYDEIEQIEIEAFQAA